MHAFSSKLPIWYQFAQMLRADILGGRLAPGSRIAPEVRLAEQHGISVMPVRQALRALEDEGLITRHRGRGTFVSASMPRGVPGTTPLEALYSTEFVRPAEVIERGVTPVPAAFARHFNGTSELAFVRRLAFREDRPWSYGTLYFPVPLRDRITTAQLRRYPLYRIMQERCGVVLVRSHFDAQAQTASTEVAGFLDIEPFSPVLCLSCVTFQASGMAIGAFQMTFPAAPFIFSFETPHMLA